MSMYSDRQLREAFHYCFLEQLLRVSDIRLYVLKGGVNLRFFFRSPRYSEDMDLDVRAAWDEMVEQVDRLLASG